MNRSARFLLAGVMIAASPALAAEVSGERLINANRERQNWLRKFKEMRQATAL
jgi:hypothetical protein